MRIPDAAVEGVAGAIGGCVAVAVTYPLITVSTIQATQPHLQQRGQRRQIPGVLGDVVEVARRGGWARLFNGLEPALLATAASQGVYYCCYSAFRRMAVQVQYRDRSVMRLMSMKNKSIRLRSSLLVAAAAGAVNVVLTSPIWVVTTRMQVHQGADGGRPHMLQVAREVYREGGVAGFFKGLIPGLVMVSNPTIQNSLFEWLTARAQLARAAPGVGVLRLPLPLELFARSAAAKLGATLLTYPMLVVKVVMQAEKKAREEEREGSGGQGRAGRGAAGAAGAAAQICSSEGPAGFFKGLNAKLFQSVLSAALLFVIKEGLVESTEALLCGGRPQRPLKRMRTVVEETREF